MNPLQNFIDNIMSGDLIVFILILMPVIAVVLAIWDLKRELQVMNIFFNEPADDAYLYGKRLLNSLRLHGSLKGFVKSGFPVTCNIYEDCLIFTANNKSMVIKDFNNIKITTELAKIWYVFRLKRDEQILTISMHQKEYEILTNFLNNKETNND